MRCVTQVHSRFPMATSTSENTRRASSTVRVCRVRVMTNRDGCSDVCSPLDVFFLSFVLFIYAFFRFSFFPCFDVGGGGGGGCY